MKHANFQLANRFALMGVFPERVLGGHVVDDDQKLGRSFDGHIAYSLLKRQIMNSLSSPRRSAKHRQHFPQREDGPPSLHSPMNLTWLNVRRVRANYSTSIEVLASSCPSVQMKMQNWLN